MRVTEDWLWETIWVAKVFRVCLALTVSNDDPEAKYTVPETLAWVTGKVVVETKAWLLLSASE